MKFILEFVTRTNEKEVAEMNLALVEVGKNIRNAAVQAKAKRIMAIARLCHGSMGIGYELRI